MAAISGANQRVFAKDRVDQQSREKEEIQKEIQSFTKGTYPCSETPLTLFMTDIKYYLIRESCSKEIATTLYNLDILLDRYSTEKDEKYYERFKNSIEQKVFPAVLHITQQKSAHPWAKSLEKRVRLFVRCLTERDDLFPLWQAPFNHLEKEILPTAEVLMLQDKLLHILFFGVKEGIGKIEEELIQKKGKGSLQLRRYVNGIKRGVVGEINKLFNLIQRFALKQFSYQMEGCLKDIGKKHIFPKQMKEIYELSTELFDYQEEFIGQFITVFNHAKRAIHPASSRRGRRKQNLQNLHDLSKTVACIFDAWIALPLKNYVGFTKKAFFGRKGKLEVYQARVKGLKEKLPKGSYYFSSYHIQNLDLFIGEQGKRIMGLYNLSDPLSKDEKFYVETILFCIGSIEHHIIELMEVSFKSCFSTGFVDKALESCVANVLNDIKKIESIEKRLKGDKKIIVQNIREDFETLYQVLYPIIKSDMRRLEYLVDVHLLSQPLYSFLINSESQNENAPKLLQFFKERCKITQTLATKLDLLKGEASISCLQNLQQAWPPSAKESQDKKLIDFVYLKSANNLTLLKEIKETFKSLSISNLKEALHFAKMLIEYEKNLHNWNEILTFYPEADETIKQWIKQVYRSVIDDDDRVERISCDLLGHLKNLYSYFHSYFLSYHAPLLRWAREEILFPSKRRTSASSCASSSSSSSSQVYLEDVIKIEEKSPIASATSSAPSSSSAPLMAPESYVLLLKSKQLLKAISIARPFLDDQRDQQIDRSKILLEKTYLPLIEEQLTSPLKEKTLYLHGETLLLYSALALEQTLKLKIAATTPSKLKECTGSHDLLKLATLAGIELSFHEEEMLRNARAIPGVTSRYLWKKDGAIANHLRALANGYQRDIDAAWVPLLRVVHRTLKKIHGKGVGRFQALFPARTSIAAVESQLQINSLLNQIESKTYQIKVAHFGSERGRLCYGNTVGTHTFIRERQILYFVENTPYYAKGIREVAPYLFSSTDLYSQTNFFMQKVTLLLEQSLLATIAYLDIPSSTQVDSHILTDKIGPKDRERPRYFDHNVERALKVLSSFLGEAELSLTPAQKKGVQKLSTFLSQEGRYLTSSKSGALAPEMDRLRTLSPLVQHKDDGFFTVEERKTLRSLYGSGELMWQKKMEEDLKELQEKTFKPLIQGALEVVDHLLDLNLQLRKERN